MSDPVSGASPSEEAVARLLCSDCGNDPDWLVGNHEPPRIATPMGHVWPVQAGAVPLWHFWVPAVKATRAALQAAGKD